MLIRTLIFITLFWPALLHAQFGAVIEKGPLSVLVSRLSVQTGDAKPPSHLVSVYTADADTEAFRVTLTYETDGKVRAVNSVIQRQRWNIPVWNSETFSLPTGARIISLVVEELKPIEFVIDEKPATK